MYVYLYNVNKHIYSMKYSASFEGQSMQFLQAKEQEHWV